LSVVFADEFDEPHPAKVPIATTARTIITVFFNIQCFPFAAP
jgi:hypothetical protein